MKAYLKEQAIKPDPDQQEVVDALDKLTQNLIKRRWWFTSSPKGIYIWGKVGRGKTFLMDSFFNALPFKHKIRLHFHRFMHNIHAQLKQYQGKTDPLRKIAKAFAKKYKVLCFDEFHVSDITDAMILAELFKAFFQEKVVIVATSNVEPRYLYPNGLQRDKFLPTIDLIYTHMEVLQLGGQKDYRLQYLSQSKCYHFPLTASAEAECAKAFHALTVKQNEPVRSIVLCDRDVPVIECADSVVWFSFAVLCESARSSEDYIEIAEYFDTVIISEVPQMGEVHEAAAKRFMHLIDELYDRHVTLIVSAEVPIEALYTGSLLKETFVRTQSRLREMQSEEYLSRPHHYTS